MSRHTWSEKNTFELIRLYEVNAALWDTKHIDYRNREVKGKIISNIAMLMNVTTEEINRKLHNLRNQVSQELNKMKKRNKDTNEMIHCSNWPYFLSLKFLIPSVINRSKNSDVTIQHMIEGKKRENSERKVDEKKKEKRRKSSDVTDEEKMRQSSHIFPQVSNEDDGFGEYVALELRSLRSEINKRKLKSEIRRAICRIADLDDADIFVPSTSSNPSPPYSPSSPAHIPVCEISNVKTGNI